MKREMIRKIDEVAKVLTILTVSLVIGKLIFMFGFDNKPYKFYRMVNKVYTLDTSVLNRVEDFGIVKRYEDETVTDSDGTIILNKGDWYYELTDGSFGLYKDGKYYFQPVMLGDWVYNLDTREDLENITQTYISMNKYGYF